MRSFTLRANLALGRPWRVLTFSSLPLLLFAVIASAATENLETLTRQMKTESDFKVRLSAALKLGQLGDRLAIPVLTDALGDAQSSVRAVAASAIAKLVDREVTAQERTRAMAALRKVAERDPEPRTQNTAKNAIEVLDYYERVARPRRPKGGIFLDVARLEDSTGQLDAAALEELTKIGREALLASTDAILVEWPGGQMPSDKDLKKAKVRAGFAVLGTITQMDIQRSGKQAVVECKLSLIQATYPDRAARAFIDGKAKLETSNRESAIERAKTLCATNIVKHLMGKRLAADVTGPGE
ncbi:MAG: hypothetical protein A2341_20695 [Deltaproteobacteria bacterium RIFOXYB12_FULL_58_9]|nr:MAG: hypothetical protein A2341_20695 [Deltaproteobacteria bacterium RIFOXYB12_FULL_58_9]